MLIADLEIDATGEGLILRALGALMTTRMAILLPPSGFSISHFPIHTDHNMKHLKDFPKEERHPKPGPPRESVRQARRTSLRGLAHVIALKLLNEGASYPSDLEPVIRKVSHLVLDASEVELLITKLIPKSFAGVAKMQANIEATNKEPA
jgi:hypothetical protein